jgi:RimJ/RimL family protein N-acetyltransferase
VIFEHQADPASSAMAGVPVRDRPAHHAHWARITAEPRVLLRAVLVPDDAGAAQLAGYLIVFDRNDERELGYALGRAFWGRGVATAALALFLEMVDERPLAAHVAAHNGASAAVLLRNGFRETGRHVAEDGVEVRDFVLD